jgi:hypothetical protein
VRKNTPSNCNKRPDPPPSAPRVLSREVEGNDRPREPTAAQKSAISAVVGADIEDSVDALVVDQCERPCLSGLECVVAIDSTPNRWAVNLNAGLIDMRFLMSLVHERHDPIRALNDRSLGVVSANVQETGRVRRTVRYNHMRTSQ